MPIGPAPGYWARNCIAISAPGVAPPALPPAAPGRASVSCAWVPVGAPLPLNNLRLTKTHCTPANAPRRRATSSCATTRSALINDGPSPYHGMLTVNETVPAASTLTVGDPTWACAGGPPVYGCNTLAAADIAVGASLAIPLQVSIPLAPLEAAGCSLPNTAAIVAPAGGSDANFDAGDDADTAIADAFLTWVDALRRVAGHLRSDQPQDDEGLQGRLRRVRRRLPLRLHRHRDQHRPRPLPRPAEARRAARLCADVRVVLGGLGLHRAAVPATSARIRTSTWRKATASS